MLGATNRYKTIISLLKQRKMAAFDRLADTADALMKRTFNPQEDRNRIIHDAWYVYEDQTAQFRSMPPKDPQFGICRVDLAKIQQTIAATDELAARAGALWRDIHAALEQSA